MPLKISFCTTCSGRLHHLKETLPRNLKNSKDYPNLEFVILDYNSADGLESWIKSSMTQEVIDSRVVYFKTFEPKYFKLSHSKNMAHRLATGDLLFNLDADTFVYGICHYLNKIFKKNKSLMCRNAGMVCCFREMFHKIRGYDETMIGWGQEDGDIYWRCINYLGAQDDKHYFEGMGHKIHHPKIESVNQFNPSYQMRFETRKYNRRITKSRTAQTWQDVNVDGYGCGTVYKNFSRKPIILSQI